MWHQCSLRKLAVAAGWDDVPCRARARSPVFVLQTSNLLRMGVQRAWNLAVKSVNQPENRSSRKHTGAHDFRPERPSL
jgi:hypothetical protein